jgi:uncharacterized membrane protein
MNSVRHYRVASIDVLRGLVIVIMALDHVRDYFMTGALQDPMADPQTGPALFLTRWITHFCAPVFVFLAGTSAGLMTSRRTARELGSLLLWRGLWLVAIEWFVISTGFTFAPLGIAAAGGKILIPMQVIWAIGASMIVLAGAQFLGRRACLAIGVAICLGHNALDVFWPPAGGLSDSPPLWVALHAKMWWHAGPYLVYFAYPLIPWVGVMMTGFGIAGVFDLPAPERDAKLRRMGLAMCAAFVLLRAIDVYVDPRPWSVHAGDAAATVMDFFNTQKYPPSLAFLLMTLGPAAVFASYADRLGDGVRRVLTTYGRVPFAFYVAHFYLIHSLALVLAWWQGFEVSRFLTIATLFPKAGYGLPLGGVYVVWILVVAALYPLCKWVSGLKARRTDWWLSYV